MKKSFALLLLATPFLTAAAADRVLDFSTGCKVYKLEAKQWVETDAASMEGLTVPEGELVRNAPFTVFKSAGGTFGVNQRCLRHAGAAPAESTPPPAPRPAPKRVGRRRSAAPTPHRGDTLSPWAAVFSFGYNLAPSGTLVISEGGVAQDPVSIKYSGSISFFGEGNYRANAAFRIAGELGLSQLQQNSQTGNETSFFDVRPEYIFRLNPKMELYVGPMLGIFFFSQNTQTSADTGLTLKQQTATTSLLGLGLGADYALNSQFDLGFFLRYFKPGTMKITGTNTTTGDALEYKLTTSYLTLGLRFVVHF